MLKLVDKKKPDLIDLDLIDKDLDFLKGILPDRGPKVPPEELEPELYAEPEPIVKPGVEQVVPDEDKFQKWYAERAKYFGLNPDPDHPEHYYDYRAAFLAGAEPDETGHWPSEFKKERHPNLIIGGIDTRTGKPELAGIPETFPLGKAAPPISTAVTPVAEYPPLEPAFREAEPKTLSQKILEQITPFKATRVEQTVQAQNIRSIAKQTGQPISVVRENYPEMMNEVMKRQGPTTLQLIEYGIAPHIAIGLSTHAAKIFLGLAKFAGAFEVINAAVSMIKDEDYQFLAGKGLSDLLPEETSQLGRETADIAEFIAVGLAAIGLSKKTPKFVEKLTKDIFTEFKASKRIIIPARKVASIFRTGEEISPEELDLIKSLSLDGHQYRMAVKQGLDIKIPAEKISTIVDKPYWIKLKSIFGRGPAERITRVERAGEQIIERAPAGELPPPRSVEGSYVRQIWEKQSFEAAAKEAAEAAKVERPIEAIPEAKEAEKPPSALAFEEARKAEELAEPTDVEKRFAKALEEEARLEAEAEKKKPAEKPPEEKIEVEPSAERWEEIQKRISQIEKHPDFVKPTIEGRALRDELIELEKEAEIHRPAAEEKAKAEIKKEKPAEVPKVEEEIKDKGQWKLTLDEYIKKYGRKGQDPGVQRAFFALNHKKWIEKALSEGKPVPAEVLKDYPDLVKEKPAEKPELSHDEKRRKRIREIEKKQFKTAGDEKSLMLLKGEIDADPAKWSVGDGVGYYAGPATSTKRGSQINRGFRIVEIDSENKTVTIKQVADTGLTVTGGDRDKISGQTIHIADLVRDTKYDTKEKPVEAPEGYKPPIGYDFRKIEGELTLKEQKEYLNRELDSAIKAAKEAEDEDLKISGVLPGKIQTVKMDDETRKKYGVITIEVPGDGRFTILNTKQSLKHFKKAARGFPTAKWKPTKPGAKPEKVPSPSGKRLTGVEYYNPFRPRKQKIVMAGKDERQFYVKGFYTEGKYLVKVDKKPESKTEYLETDKELENSVVSITKGVKKAIPAEMVAETFPMRELDVEDIAEKRYERVQPKIHAVAENGEHYIYQAHYIDAVLTEHPNSKISILPQEEEGERAVVGTLYFEKGGEVVGVVTPMTPKGEGPPSGKLEDMHEVIQEGYAELTGKVKPAEVEVKPERLERLKKPKVKLPEELQVSEEEELAIAKKLREAEEIPEVEELTAWKRAAIGTHVAELGSIKKVAEYYPGKGKPDTFARERAEELFGKEKPVIKKAEVEPEIEEETTAELADKMSPTLMRKADEDVKALGSIEKVNANFTDTSLFSRYARAKARELFGEKPAAPSGLADTGRYADIGEYKVPPETEGPGPSAMDLPEIVELARQLMEGKLPKIKKRLRGFGVLGRFRARGKGAIELRAGIFKDQLQGAKVLAHEVGHLVDWLPEKTMARGNILGRIASLKKYLKHFLVNRPGSAGPITDADRARLRKEARKLAKAESGKLIDEEIRRELPITPEDVLAIWNDATFDLKKNEPLYRYIQSLSREEKKSIVKEALKGEVPRRLKQFAKIVIEKTGRKIKAKPTEKEIYEKYKELVRKEIEKRRLFQMDKIMNELIDFTHEWKPFDPLVNPNYTRYRYSSPELYADALSALITNPGYLRKKAPHFYEGFFNYLERKPEVKALYEQIQDEIKSGDAQRSLVIRTRQGFLKREEELKSLLKRTRNWLTLDALGTVLIDQNFAISRRVWKVGESNIPENFNPIYKLEEWRHSGTEAEGYLVDFNANVLEPLTKAGLSHIDLGEYLMHWRIATERAEFANPLGWTPERSKQRIKEMDKTFGPILKEVKDAFKNLREDWFLSKIEDAKMYSPELEKTIMESEHYVTFDIIGHLEKSYGRPASGHIYRQIGTFTETGNPLTATVIKDILIMRSINKNIAAKAVVDLFSEHFPKEIKPADTRWNGRFHEIQESASPDTKLMVVMQEGKLKGYYLPKFVAESFRQNPAEANVICRLLRLSFVPFRMLFTELNPGFWTFNLARDYKAAAKQLPKLKYSTFLKYWFKGIPPAFKGAFGKPDEITKKALKNKSLLSIASYHWDAPEDLELERLLKRYGITKSYWNTKVAKPITIFIDGMRNTARAMERIPKLGGHLYLKEKFPQMTEEKVAHLVRARSGSPDFMRTGTGAPIYNYLLPFSNAMKEGTRSAFEAATENFGEYLWKTIKYNILWKLVMLGAKLGLLGYMTKRIVDGISDYDLANYNCYPIGLTETGKSVYIRIPQDETGRIIGGTWWMMAEKEYPKAFQSMFDYAAGQVPSFHPMITGAWAATEYMGGRNPYDHFRSRPIIDNDVFLAGGKRSHTAFAKWTSNQFGGGIIHRFKHDGIREVQTDLERFLNTPITSNVVGRFVKVSDYGIRQKVNEELRQVASMAAEDRLLMNEALVKLLEAKGENITNEEIMAMVKNIDSLPYYTTKALTYKYGNVFMQKLITARSNEQKAVILRQMIAYMPYAQKIGPTQYLDSMVKEIKERIKK